MPPTPTFTCFSCHRDLLAPKSTRGVDTRPTFGSLILCGSCGEINLIELTGTRSLTEKELSTMPEEIAKELRVAARAIHNIKNNN